VRIATLVLGLAIGCRGDAKPPPTPSPARPAPIADATPHTPAPEALDAKSDTVDSHDDDDMPAEVVVAPLEPVVSIAAYCRAHADREWKTTPARPLATQPPCGVEDQGPTLALPTGWHLTYFLTSWGESEPVCDAMLEVGGARYALEDLGITCGGPVFGTRCHGRAEVIRAGTWIGLVTTHADVNPFSDNLPTMYATEQLRICRARGPVECSDPIAIGRRSCHSYSDGPPGGDGLRVDWTASQLHVEIHEHELVLTWAHDTTHDATLKPGRFALH
jgi:hypothetical protein